MTEFTNLSLNVNENGDVLVNQTYLNILDLVLANDEIKIIPNNLLVMFPQARLITVLSKKLESINLHKMYLRNFLKTLYIVGGAFEVIADFSFEDFWFLKTLYIHYVPIKILEKYAFNDMSSLEDLSITNHKI